MTLLKEKIKARLGPLLWYSAMLFCVQRVGDVINLFTGLWLVPKWVPASELGALLPLGQLGTLFGLPLAILLMPFTKFLNTFGAREEYGKVKALLCDALLMTGVAGCVVAVYTWCAAPLVFERLRLDGSVLVWLLCGIAVSGAFLPVLNNGLSALKMFRCMSVVSLSAAPVRLAFLLALLPVYGLLGFFSSQFLFNVVTLGVSVWGLRRVLSPSVRRESYRGHWREMIAYTVPVAAMMVVCNLSSAVQLLLIRQRLPDVESAAYYFCSRFAEIPNVFWGAVALTFFPYVSEAFEKGRDTRRLLIQVLLCTVGGGGVIAVVLALGIGWVFNAVPNWRDYAPFSGMVGWLALTNVLRSAFACFYNHELACRRFAFLWYLVPAALMSTAALMALTGYGFFEPWLPAAWIDWMASVRAARLGFIVGAMVVTDAVIFAGVVLQLVFKRSAARTV